MGEGINTSVLYAYELELNSVILNYNTTWTTITFTLSTIGMCLSSLALLLLILTAVFFVEWRISYKNQLLLQFMIARYFYTFMRYLADIQNAFNVLTAIRRLLTFNALVMIYTEMALISWMFLFSRQMYISLVKVFDTQIVSIWKLSLLGWILPALVSIIFYAIHCVTKENSAIALSSMLITIKWPIMITNAYFLVSVLKSLLTNKRKAKNNVKVILVMMSMIFVFCFQQMFKDIFVLIQVLSGEVSMMSLTFLTSNVLTLYQCAFSILFWLFGNENTRKLWQFQNRGSIHKSELNVRYST